MAGASVCVICCWKESSPALSSGAVMMMPVVLAIGADKVVGAAAVVASGVKD